jgi:hypothetical protein
LSNNKEKTTPRTPKQKRAENGKKSGKKTRTENRTKKGGGRK